MSAWLPETLQGISITRALLRHHTIFPTWLWRLPAGGSEELSTRRWICAWAPCRATGSLGGVLGVPS